MSARSTAAAKSGLRYLRHADLGVEHVSGNVLGHRFRPHSHDTYLVGLTVGGCENVIQNGREFRSRPGNIRLINPGEVHAGGCEGNLPWSYEALYLPCPLVREVAATLGVVAARPRLTPPVLDHPPLARNLAGVFEMLRQEEDARRRGEVLGGFVVALLDRALDRGPRDEREDAANVSIIRLYLERHAFASVLLDELADHAGLSKFHLVRLFKTATGLTPGQYQTQLRVEHAKQLLAGGETPSHVASDCGFVDQSHLTRHFRQLVGMPPAAFAHSIRPRGPNRREA